MANFMKGFGGDGGIAKNIGTKAGEVVEDTVNKVMGGMGGGQNKEQPGGNKEKAAAGEGGNQAAGQEGSAGNGGGHGVDLNKLAGGLFK